MWREAEYRGVVEEELRGSLASKGEEADIKEAADSLSAMWHAGSMVGCSKEQAVRERAQDARRVVDVDRLAGPVPSSAGPGFLYIRPAPPLLLGATTIEGMCLEEEAGPPTYGTVGPAASSKGARWAAVANAAGFEATVLTEFPVLHRTFSMENIQLDEAAGAAGSGGPGGDQGDGGPTAYWVHDRAHWEEAEGADLTGDLSLRPRVQLERAKRLRAETQGMLPDASGSKFEEDPTTGTYGMWGRLVACLPGVPPALPTACFGSSGYQVGVASLSSLVRASSSAPYGSAREVCAWTKRQMARFIERSDLAVQSVTASAPSPPFLLASVDRFATAEPGFTSIVAQALETVDNPAAASLEIDAMPSATAGCGDGLWASGVLSRLYADSWRACGPGGGRFDVEGRSLLRWMANREIRAMEHAMGDSLPAPGQTPSPITSPVLSTDGQMVPHFAGAGPAASGTPGVVLIRDPLAAAESAASAAAEAAETAGDAGQPSGDGDRRTAAGEGWAADDQQAPEDGDSRSEGLSVCSGPTNPLDLRFHSRVGALRRRMEGRTLMREAWHRYQQDYDAWYEGGSDGEAPTFRPRRGMAGYLRLPDMVQFFLGNGAARTWIAEALGVPFGFDGNDEPGGLESEFNPGGGGGVEEGEFKEESYVDESKEEDDADERPEGHQTEAADARSGPDQETRGQAAATAAGDSGASAGGEVVLRNPSLEEEEGADTSDLSPEELALLVDTHGPSPVFTSPLFRGTAEQLASGQYAPLPLPRSVPFDPYTVRADATALMAAEGGDVGEIQDTAMPRLEHPWEQIRRLKAAGHKTAKLPSLLDIGARIQRGAPDRQEKGHASGTERVVRGGINVFSVPHWRRYQKLMSGDTDRSFWVLQGLLQVGPYPFGRKHDRPRKRRPRTKDDPPPKPGEDPEEIEVITPYRQLAWPPKEKEAAAAPLPEPLLALDPSQPGAAAASASAELEAAEGGLGVVAIDAPTAAGSGEAFASVTPRFVGDREQQAVVELPRTQSAAPGRQASRQRSRRRRNSILATPPTGSQGVLTASPRDTAMGTLLLNGTTTFISLIPEEEEQHMARWALLNGGAIGGLGGAGGASRKSRRRTASRGRQTPGDGPGITSDLIAPNYRDVLMRVSRELSQRRREETERERQRYQEVQRKLEHAIDRHYPKKEVAKRREAEKEARRRWIQVQQTQSKWPEQVQFLRIPFKLGAVPALPTVLAACKEIERRLFLGEKVYLFSGTGRGRASMLAACVLGRLFGLDADGACDRVFFSSQTATSFLVRPPRNRRVPLRLLPPIMRGGDHDAKAVVRERRLAERKRAAARRRAMERERTDDGARGEVGSLLSNTNSESSSAIKAPDLSELQQQLLDPGALKALRAEDEFYSKAILKRQRLEPEYTSRAWVEIVDSVDEDAVRRGLAGRPPSAAETLGRRKPGSRLPRILQQQQQQQQQQLSVGTLPALQDAPTVPVTTNVALVQPEPSQSKEPRQTSISNVMLMPLSAPPPMQQDAAAGRPALGAVAGGGSSAVQSLRQLRARWAETERQADDNVKQLSSVDTAHGCMVASPERRLSAAVQSRRLTEGTGHGEGESWVGGDDQASTGQTSSEVDEFNQPRHARQRGRAARIGQAAAARLAKWRAEQRRLKESDTASRLSEGVLRMVDGLSVVEGRPSSREALRLESQGAVAPPATEDEARLQDQPFSGASQRVRRPGTASSRLSTREKGVGPDDGAAEEEAKSKPLGELDDRFLRFRVVVAQKELNKAQRDNEDVAVRERRRRVSLTMQTAMGPSLAEEMAQLRKGKKQPPAAAAAAGSEADGRPTPGSSAPAAQSSSGWGSTARSGHGGGVEGMLAAGRAPLEVPPDQESREQRLWRHRAEEFAARAKYRMRKAQADADATTGTFGGLRRKAEFETVGEGEEAPQAEEEDSFVRLMREKKEAEQKRLRAALDTALDNPHFSANGLPLALGERVGDSDAAALRKQMVDEAKDRYVREEGAKRFRKGLSRMPPPGLRLLPDGSSQMPALPVPEMPEQRDMVEAVLTVTTGPFFAAYTNRGADQTVNWRVTRVRGQGAPPRMPPLCIDLMMAVDMATAADPEEAMPAPGPADSSSSSSCSQSDSEGDSHDDDDDAE